MNPARPAASVGKPGIADRIARPIASMAVSGPAAACAAPMSDHAAKIAARPRRVPIRSSKAPAGT
jgi:hypothetical protein